MKVAFVGPGLLPIPPQGWGAVETVIANLDRNCRAIGCETIIVNTTSKHVAISMIDSFSPDIVWLHYDVYAIWFTNISSNSGYKIWNTGHFAYLSQYSNRVRLILPLFLLFQYLHPIAWRLLCAPLKLAGHKSYSMFTYLRILACSKYLAQVQSVHQVYLSSEIYGSMNSIIGGTSSVLPNCANEETICYTDRGGNGRALCLGKIEPRKRQRYLSTINDIDFVGPIVDSKFPSDHPNYLGIWSTPQVHKRLTDYSALVLLSDGEAHALVIIEALLAGLSVLLSVQASSHLQQDLPFVTIVENENISDLEHIELCLTSLLAYSHINRPLARAYALQHFSCSAQQRNLRQLFKHD